MSKVVKSTNWALVFVAYFALISMGFVDNLRGPYFADIIFDLQLSDTQGALFFAVTSTMAFVSGGMVPRLVKQFGLLTILRLGHITLGLGFASIALAKDLLTMVATCGLFGFGFGLINVVQNLLILDATTGEKRRRLLSGLHAMYAFASLIAPLIAAQLFRWNFSWRQAFVGFGSFSSIALISTFFASTSEKKILQPERHSRNPNRRHYFLMASVVSWYIIAELIITTRLPLYLRRVYDYSPAQAAILLAAFFFFMLAGRLYVLWVPIAATNTKIIESCLILSFFVLALGLFVHPWILSLCGLTIAPIFSTSIDMMAEKFPLYPTDAISYMLAVSCVYIVTMHFSIGIVADIFGVSLAMKSGLVFLLTSWVLLKIYQRRELLSDS